MSRANRLLPASLVSCVALAALSLTGCGDRETIIPTYPVSGRVLRGDVPIFYATVVLHPKSDIGDQSLRPRGVTNADGTFSLTTFTADDGAPAGDYEVSVTQWTTDKPEEGPKNRLAGKYADPATSGIQIKVSSGPNEVPAIVIP